MTSCSIHVYIDATSEPIRVEYESTCETLYVCSGSECRLVSSRGSTTRLQARFKSLSELLPVTPTQPWIPQPLPHFSISDIAIIVDSKPASIDVYGLPYRRSTVIGSVKRTVLEGRWVLQLASNEQGLVIGEEVLVVKGWLEAEAIYPLIPETVVEKAQHLLPCLYPRGDVLIEWGSCIYRYGEQLYSVLREYRTHVTSIAGKRGYGPDLVAGLARLYSGLAAASNIHPIRLGEALAAASTWAPIYTRKTPEGYTLYTMPPGLLVRLRRSMDSSSYVFETFVGRDGVKLDNYNEIAVLCKECWEPIIEYGNVESDG
ncbi:hypothetical protein [Hyperthermus butylicus]|uniref:Uncharacterized protein n=1 Tax=Hyperthermus butylicus (strain DSM 5456 / JCM 9403 / PLM1-5) TaxID=415426 RepID=A2BM17_HYPBU|nr:hypothetical protein [Hyperthermus butylicus]ABM81028.1 hypothetical protein Hbut_1194 [Hyperthermus butylicus DSM 5456]